MKEMYDLHDKRMIDEDYKAYKAFPKSFRLKLCLFLMAICFILMLLL